MSGRFGNTSNVRMPSRTPSGPDPFIVIRPTTSSPGSALPTRSTKSSYATSTFVKAAADARPPLKGSRREGPMHVYRVRTPNLLRSRSKGFGDGRHGGPDPAARGTAREGRLHGAHDCEPLDVPPDLLHGHRKAPP